MKENEIRPLDLFNRYLELSRRDIGTFFSDRSDFISVDCPACGSAERTPGLEKEGFKYELCLACGTLYLSPRPSAERLGEYYRVAESVRFWSTNFYKETADARREKIHKPRAALVANLIQRYSNNRDLRFTDIGSGYGIFLEEIRKLGVFREIGGIEPNGEMAEICRSRGFQVIEKTLEEVVPGETQTDFATAFEVLEHVFDPLEFLRAARGLLGPEGIVFLTTLTVSGFDIQVLWKESKSVHPPHHINLISVSGMERLIQRSGLSILEVSTPGLLDVDIVANATAENPNLEIPRFVRTLLESSDGTRKNFQSFLAANRLSSHIRIVAKIIS